MNVGKLCEMLESIDRLVEKCGAEEPEQLTEEEMRDVARYLKQYARSLRQMEFLM